MSKMSREAGERIQHGAHLARNHPGGPGRAVVWMASITALGGLLFGYDTGVVSGALLFLKNDFPHITSLQKELVTSLLLVGAAIEPSARPGWPTASAVGPRS
jgi:hypothetical protein